MDDSKKKDKKVKKKENTDKDTNQESNVEETKPKDDIKETEESDLTHQFEVEECRMHEQEYPSSNDLVYCFVTEIFTDGAYVQLLEYNNIKGMILNSEMSRRNVKQVKKIIKENKQEVLRVLRVDQNQGYIDLTRKQIKADEIKEKELEFSKLKTVHSIIKMLAQKLKLKKMLPLYKQIVWPLISNSNNNAYDCFKEQVLNLDNAFKSLKLPEETRQALLQILQKKMTPQPVKIFSDFKLTCTNYEGIEGIKHALTEGEKLSNSEIIVKCRIRAAPIYECYTNTIKIDEGFKIINEALKTIESEIKKKQGNFLLHTKPTIVGEKSGKELEQPLEEMNEEEEEEEFEEGIRANIKGFEKEKENEKDKKKSKKIIKEESSDG